MSTLPYFTYWIVLILKFMKTDVPHECNTYPKTQLFIYVLGFGLDENASARKPLSEFLEFAGVTLHWPGTAWSACSGRRPMPVAIQFNTPFEDIYQRFVSKTSRRAVFNRRRIPHVPSSTSGFQIERRIVLSGDMKRNRGQKPKEFQNVLARNEVSRTKTPFCVSNATLEEHYLNHSNIDWTRDCYALPGVTDSYLAEDIQVHLDAAVEREPTTDPAIQMQAEMNTEPVPDPYESAHHSGLKLIWIAISNPTTSR